MFIAHFEFMIKSTLQLLELFLKSRCFQVLLAQLPIALHLLFVDMLQLLELLVKNLLAMMSITLQVTLDLIMIFVFYYILVKFQLNNAFCLLQLFTQGFCCIITQQIVHHINAFNRMCFFQVIEDDSTHRILNVTVSHFKMSK